MPTNYFKLRRKGGIGLSKETYDPLQLKLRGIGKVAIWDMVIKIHPITLSLKWISTNFPNLLLLLFLIVLALPNDSRRGFAKITLQHINH